MTWGVFVYPSRPAVRRNHGTARKLSKFLSSLSKPRTLEKTNTISVVPHYETPGSHCRTTRIDGQKILNYDTVIEEKY